MRYYWHNHGIIMDVPSGNQTRLAGKLPQQNGYKWKLFYEEIMGDMVEFPLPRLIAGEYSCMKHPEFLISP